MSWQEPLFSVIAALAIVLNLLFGAFLLRRPSFLKKPHNVLLFCLSSTDLLTGILLILTPGYVISKASYPVPSGAAGDAFCWLLGSRYLLFTAGKVSILIVMCLAVERWYCVLRPVQYKRHFTTRRSCAYVFLAYIAFGLLQINKFFEYRESGGKCVVQKGFYGAHGTQAMVVSYTIASFVFPSVITWGSYVHIWLRLKRRVGAINSSEHARNQQKLLLRMCAVTSVIMTLCWLPAQITYVLSPFGVTKVGSPLHKSGHVLAMLNSCVNPCIYWLTNKEYRKGLVGLFKKGVEVNPESTAQEHTTQHE